MISALLFDLDGTLLRCDMDFFMPHYFRALATKLAPIMPPDQLTRVLNTSVRMMMQTQDSPQTNHDRFWAEMLPRINRPLDAMQLLLDDFYKFDFPALRRYTAMKLDARPLMEAAFAAGYTVAIATQPVFPLVAIQQRLEWAGVADFPYALITSYEIMHTTKPHPAFYRDVCAMIGHRPEDCLMVGNDPDSDIRPAAAAGLHTFWLADEGQPPIADLPAEHSGALRDVHRLILSWRT